MIINTKFDKRQCTIFIEKYNRFDQADDKVPLLTHGIVHSGFSGFIRFAARKKQLM